MINLDYLAPSIGVIPSDWFCYEFECEKNGVKLVVYTPKPNASKNFNHRPLPIQYYLYDGESNCKHVITEDVYNIIKKLILK